MSTDSSTKKAHTATAASACHHSTRCATNGNRLGDGFVHYGQGGSDHLVNPPDRQDATVDFLLTGGVADIGAVVIWPQNEYNPGRRDVKTVAIYNKPEGASDWVLVTTSGTLTQSKVRGANTPTTVMLPAESKQPASQWRVMMKTFWSSGSEYAGFMEIEFFGCS